MEGGWETRTFGWPTRPVEFSQPIQPDDLLNLPANLAAKEATNYMPYWAFLWRSSLTLSETITRTPWTPGTRALELGAGLGLVGLAALTCGLDVTFSDHEPQAIQASLWNARQNGYQAEGVLLDWQEPLEKTWPLIFAADVLYEEYTNAWIVELLQAMLTPGGDCWIGDPGRQLAPRFAALASTAGFEVTFLTDDCTPIPHYQPGQFHIMLLHKPAE